MMKYERFAWKTEKLQHLDDEIIIVVDNANKEWKGHILNVVDLLNNLTEENEQLQKEKEYYREYALQYLLGYEFYSDNFLNTIKNTISEEEVKKIKEEENKIIEALKKEELYE